MSVQRRKTERPGEILEAAFEEFSQKGFAATRLDDVAARADVTKGTIYVYFSSKEELFETMVRQLMAPVVDKTGDLLSIEAETPEQVIRAFLSFVYDNLARERRTRELIRLLLLETDRFPILIEEHYETFIEPVMGKLRALLLELQAKGKIRSLPAVDFPELFLGPAMSLTIWRLMFRKAPEIDTDAHMEGVLDLFLNGLQPSVMT